MVFYATYNSPFGPIEIGHENGYITSIRRGKGDSPHQPAAVTDLANIQLQEYFTGSRKVFDLPLSLIGTPFQKAVWHCIQEIPYGEVRSYGEIAAVLGRPRACRAVGQAANRNPVWIVIPCHRVVGANRKLTGYAGGLDMKRTLLDLEINAK